MEATATKLPGVTIIQPTVHGDDRGFFLESYHETRYRDIAGIELPFVQDNHSRSSRGVLRGLHLQVKQPQGKLVRVVRGEVFDVAVDVNPASPTYCEWVGVTLSEENHTQLYIPPGYAHGFLVISETADFQYKCTDFYAPGDEDGYRWDDPAFGINWPGGAPLLSDKDQKHPLISERN